MAIQGNYDISTAGGAYKAWYNYNYGGNTLNVSEDDIGKINDNYAREIATTWAQRATNDNNKYEITDDIKVESKKNGEERGKKVSEHDGSTNSSKTAVVGAYAGTVVAASAAVYASVAAINGGANSVWSLAGTIAFGIAAALLVSVAAALKSSKPNSEQAAACEKLTEEMGNAQSEIAEQDSIMEAADEELQSLSEDAEEINEDANDENEEKHADFSIFKEIYDGIIQKLQNGEPLTEEEKEELQAVIPILQQLGIEIQETTEDTSEEVNDIYDEMGEQQETFDTASEKIEEINGLTDFAASFDEATKDNAKMVKHAAEAGIIGSYLVSGGAAIAGAAAIAKKSTIFTFAAGVAQAIQAGIITIAGLVAKSLFGSVKDTQEQYAQIAETEIAAREATQDLNTGLTDVYDERIEGFEGYLGTVEDLELKVPDDTKMPENVEIPVGEEEPADGDNTDNGVPTLDKDKDYNSVMGNGNVSGVGGVLNNSIPQNDNQEMFVDNNGKVVLNAAYANAIKTVVGDDSGNPFPLDVIPDILASFLPSPFNDAETIRNVQNGQKVDDKYVAKILNTLTKEENGSKDVNNSEKATAAYRKVINFYGNIFQNAALNGWTDGAGGGSIADALNNGTIKKVKA